MTKPRHLLKTALALAIGLKSGQSQAQVMVNVTAQPRISASIQCSDGRGDCSVLGSLEDDLGNPMPNQELRISLDPQASAGLKVRSCDDNDVHSDLTPVVKSRTNEAGKFCVRVQNDTAPVNSFLTVEFAGAGGYEPALNKLSLNSAQPTPTLAVLEAPSRFTLGTQPSSVVVQLSAQGHATGGLEVSLLLLNPLFRGNKDQQKEIARTTTDSSGIARFSISREMLGDPGPAQLRVQFAGSNTLQPVSVTWPILKTCSVQLQTQLERPTGEIGDSIAIDIAATSNCGKVNDGSLEIALNQKPQAALRIRDGHVRWRLSTFMLSPGEYTVLVRYVPSSAGFVAESPHSLVLQLTPTSNQRRALWLVSGSLVFLWFAWRWLGGNARRRNSGPNAKREDKPQSLEVEPSTTPEFGWVGAIFDSHTGTPIAGAKVSVLVPGFREVRAECHLLSRDDGTFRLSQQDFPVQSVLSVSAAGYVSAEWPMPKPGKLIVRLETRRRAVVRTFVHWADKAIPRPNSAPEPTPADVRSLAELRSLDEVGRWASRIEHAAFGPEEAGHTDETTFTPPPHDSLGHKPTR